jgi:hypothetical protein
LLAPEREALASAAWQLLRGSEQAGSVFLMAIRIALGGLLAISICAGTAWSQESGNISDEVQKGHGG